jgi:hypothetical protein
MLNEEKILPKEKKVSHIPITLYAQRTPRVLASHSRAPLTTPQMKIATFLLVLLGAGATTVVVEATPCTGPRSMDALASKLTLTPR